LLPETSFFLYINMWSVETWNLKLCELPMTKYRLV
jgi:hypothetical protein